MKIVFEKYQKTLMFIGLFLLIYFLYFHNLWAYSLLDVDETRYVDMSRTMRESKDFLTLFLNGQFFFEKPPLYFWLENISFNVFSRVDEFTARIPGCIEGIISAFAIFFCVKRYTSNRKFAAISGLLLLSFAEFLVLAKIAILDILLATTVTLSIVCGFMTFRTSESYKKYFWWGFYIFSALAVMAKGIPGFILPFGVMFFCGLYTKQLKQYFKPQYFLIGFLLFFLLIIPWHILMIKTYNPLFWDEYIIKHHIARFLGSDIIHRQAPFWFYIPALLWGTLPYTASFVAMIYETPVMIRNFKLKPYNPSANEENIIIFSLIATAVIFLFFTASGTKLITYILPIYPWLAVLLGKYWNDYIQKGVHNKPMTVATIVFNTTCVILGIIGAIILPFLPEPLKGDLQTVALTAVFATVIFPAIGLWALKKQKRGILFLSYLLMITFLSGFGFHKFMEMDYRFGQNDLIEFAQYAKANNLNIYTYKTGARYSLLYYSHNNAQFNVRTRDINKILDNPNNMVIAKKKHLHKLGNRYKVLFTGRKYVILSK